MTKVLEYLAVAVAGILAFGFVVTISFSASRESLQKDCQKMGQHRSAGLLIKCEVLEVAQ